MPQTLTDLLNDCAVRLYNVKEQAGYGSGFFVAPGLVVTCAHVVMYKKLGDHITIRWRGDNYVGRLESVFPYPCPEHSSPPVFPDVALVSVDITQHPCVLMEKGCEVGDELYAFGFTEGHPTGHPVPVKANGVTGFVDPPADDSQFLIFGGENIPPGLSGAPLLNRRTGAVCGMVKRTRHPQEPWGGYAVRAEAIFKHFEHLPRLQRRFHQQNPQWLSATGRYSSAVAERWKAWEGELLKKEFLPRIDYHKFLLPSPLSDAWEQFITQRCWHDRLDSCLQRLREVGNHPHLAQLVAPYRVIDCKKNYRQLLKEVLDLEPQQLVTDLSGVIAHLLRKKDQAREKRSKVNFTQEDEDLLDLAHKLREVAKNMEDFLETSFGRCFCVMGALGSGRTHFIASLLGQPGKWDGHFLLPLRSLPADDDLAAWLLTPLRQFSGVNWHSLEECDADLTAHGKRLVIVIDDLQALWNARPSFEEQLRHFVEATTQLHSLYWLFMLHDTAYDTVCRDKGFWAAYGYKPDAPGGYAYSQGDGPTAYAVGHRNGLLMLNELNRANSFGFRLLQALGKRQLAADLVDGKATIILYLAAPFIAWIIDEVVASDAVTNLVTLNFVAFVDRFWENRLKYAEVCLRNDQIKDCVRRLAEYFVKQGDFTPPRAAVVNALSPHDIRWANTALEALEKMSLVTELSNNLSIDEWDEPERIELQFELFWHRHLAAQLRKIWEGVNFDIVAFRAHAESVLRSSTASHVREGIWEFFLLLSEESAMKDPARQEAVWQVWQLALEQNAVSDGLIPAQSVFFAGARGSALMQKRLVAHTRNTCLSYQSGRLLFGLMHFLSESEVIAFPDRIELLRPHYDGIQKYDLTEYYLFLSQRLVNRETELSALLTAMHHFAGSYVLGSEATKELAETCFDRILELTHDGIEELVVAIVKFLLDDGLCAEGEYSSTTGKPRGCYFFREWLLKLFCKRVLEEKGIIEAFAIFARETGYSTDYRLLPRYIAAETEREITLAFGHWYRYHRSRRHRREVGFYRDLVERLFRGEDGVPSTSAQKTAYFLIRHSGTNDEGWIVDSHFASIVSDIRQPDSTMHHLLDRYPIALINDLSVPTRSMGPPSPR